ncbi:MAG TPA: hypothetical protein VJ001_11020 [Rhodocyclaceae bacterium]|nr:hypothetical protein [Rhodocyclaceae bacterium]
MKKLLTASAVVWLSLCSFAAQAGQFGDVREKVLAVRTSMIDLLMNKDSRQPAQWKAADEKSAAAKTALAALKAPAGKEAQFAELKTVVTAFLDTRDKELRDALVAGKEDEAKRLLTVVQKDRFAKITALTEALDK